MNRIDREIDDFLRKSLDERLRQCTPRQQERFHKFFPAPIKSEKLRDAISLCDRTIAKNNEADEARDMIAGIADLSRPALSKEPVR